MPVEDFRARSAAQSSAAELTEAADIVVHNDGDLETLASEADRVWAELSKSI